MGIRFSEFTNKVKNSKERAIASRIDEAIVPSAIRERFFSPDAFCVGSLVESDNKKWEIIDKRSNYLVLCNESGETIKRFPNQVKELGEGTLEYAPNTFKGIPVPDQMRLIIETATNKDPFAIIKSLKTYSTGDVMTTLNIARSLGSDVRELVEANQQDQISGIVLVANAIGVSIESKNPVDAMKELKKRAKTVTMSDRQKKIYTDMLALLKKLGLSIDESIETAIKKHTKKNTDDSNSSDEAEPEDTPPDNGGPNKDQAVDNNPTEYELEKEILGFETFKKRLAKHTGAYADGAPAGDAHPIEVGVGPGSSLNNSSRGHRHLKVKYMSDM